MTVEQAVASAKGEMSRLFPHLLRDLRLEEAETPLSNGKSWRLTFSMAAPEPAESDQSSIATLLRASRAQKVVELADSGDLLSIRNP